MSKKVTSTSNWGKNIYRTCPSCVEEHGWPDGFKPTELDIDRQEYWKSQMHNKIEVVRTEREHAA